MERILGRGDFNELFSRCRQQFPESWFFNQRSKVTILGSMETVLGTMVNRLLQKGQSLFLIAFERIRRSNCVENMSTFGLQFQSLLQVRHRRIDLSAIQKSNGDMVMVIGGTNYRASLVVHLLFTGMDVGPGGSLYLHFIGEVCDQ